MNCSISRAGRISIRARKPKDRLFTKAGNPTARLAHAIRQVARTETMSPNTSQLCKSPPARVAVLLVSGRGFDARDRRAARIATVGQVTLVHSLRGEAARKTSPLSDQPRSRRTVPSPPRPTLIAIASETAACMLGHHRTFLAWPCLHPSSGRPVICADAIWVIAPHSLHLISIGLAPDRSIIAQPPP